MSDELRLPPKKDPQKRSVSPTRPPEARSRASLGLTAAAAEGRFALQVCGECQTVQYPPRDACSSCIGTDLVWTDLSPKGELLAETTIQTSTKLFFRERAPWRMGSVKLDVGPVVLCHIHGDCERGGRVVMLNRLDASGQGVLLAIPPERTAHMEDDPQLRAMTANPKHRRILITDAWNPNTPALAQALLDAGAATVFVGESESWRPHPNRDFLEGMDGVEVLPLDVTDTASVQRLAGEIGGKTDVLVNNAGGAPFADAATVSPRFSESIIHLNLIAPLNFGQAANRVMQTQASGGSIINIASVSSLRPSPGTAAYGAAKAGLVNLGTSLAVEWGPKVRINAVVVGLTETEQAHLHYGDEAGIAAVGAGIPLGRMAVPTDIANACLFLASPAASYVSGTNFAVHGGGEKPAFLDAANPDQA